MPGAIIIGSGLGGLECGYILAREGWDVTILEKEAQIGGCMQTFKRGNTTFDTGFHYVGGLGKGEILNILFRYFHLDTLPWTQIDPECVEEIHFSDRTYRIPSGWDRFESYLISEFPDQEEGIRAYSEKIRSVCDSIYSLTSPDRDKSSMEISAHDYLCKTFTDQRLIELLESDVTKLNYADGRLPLYVYSQIKGPFIQSAWRLKGGGNILADRLASEIKSYGGRIITGTEVVEFQEDGGTATAILTADGRKFEADLFISDAHPQQTVRMLMNARSVKKAFRSRIFGMQNSIGALTASIKLKPGSLKYRDSSIFIKGEGSGNGMMIFFGMPAEGEYAPSLDIIMPVDISLFEQWKGVPGYSRDKGYIARKEELAEECIAHAGKIIPGLSDAVEKIYISTPLTYLRYTGTADGSAFGIEKDWESPLTTFLSPRTPLRNLLLTGQSLNLHGILGVTITSLLTCSEAVGRDLTKEIIRR